MKKAFIGDDLAYLHLIIVCGLKNDNSHNVFK